MSFETPNEEPILTPLPDAPPYAAKENPMFDPLSLYPHLDVPQQTEPVRAPKQFSKTIFALGFPLAVVSPLLLFSNNWANTHSIVALLDSIHSPQKATFFIAQNYVERWVSLALQSALVLGASNALLVQAAYGLPCLSAPLRVAGVVSRHIASRCGRWLSNMKQHVLVDPGFFALNVAQGLVLGGCIFSCGASRNQLFVLGVSLLSWSAAMLAIH
jgi:hypothetical protein